MQDWRLLAIIGFSAAGALVLLLLMVTIIFNRRRRCTHMHYSAKVLQLEDSLKAVQVEKEVQDETCCSLRRSVEDFDAERSLLMKRLESCDRNSTSEELRQCTRETQLYLAIQAANSRQWRRAVDADRKDGPPALLAEAWLVHGELYRPRDESSYPNLDDLPPVFSQSRGSFHGTRRAGSGCLTSSTSADSVPVRDATGPPSLRRFHSCAVHSAAPGLSRRRQRHPVVCPGPSDFSHTEAVTTTQTLPASTAGGCCEDESMTITESGANETEDGGYRGSVSHTTTDSETCGGSCGDEKTVRVTSPLTGCTTTGTQPDTSVEVDSSSCRADCCTESKPCCGTVVIPAHTFAPEYVFLGEQWLPGPYEAAKTCVHEIPLVRLAKSSRMDHMKADGLDTDLYRKILPEAHKLEKAVIFSGCPRQVDLGSTRDRIRLQSHALIDLLPSLRVSTKSMEFPHLCYSLIEYQLQKLTAISKSALRGYVGDALNQPLYLLLRVFECKSVILASPPVSPANREASVLASEEEQDRWEMLYEAPPVCVVDAEGRFVDDGSIVFDEDSAFQYKHPFTPKPSKLLETADQVPPDCNPPVRSGCPSGLMERGGFIPECTSQEVVPLRQGLLFKDNVLSVSCVVGTTAFPERNAFHASIELSVVNRGSSGIESLSEETALQAGFHSVHATVENVEQEALACSVSPFVRAPPAGSRTPGRVIQTISATIMQPFQVVPEVTLEVVLPDGAEHRCTFALPLIVTQFMKPLTLLPAAFMQLWFDGSLHSRLMSVRISSRLMAAGPEELLRVVTFNGKFKASNGIKHRLAEGSIFAIGELAAIGDMVTDCKCLVRLSQAQCGALAMAKLETKAQDRRVAAAVFELLAYLLEDAE
ncbi:transmembrane protein [Cystoisospora suis]|uniref:Transmembrane protein n=1 Tax=Cystoisospora suis TaxID=483139 RepID=A0A2C6L503_9APIC|nr:transmembrane protein [Cystoisospora suis]